MLRKVAYILKSSYLCTVFTYANFAVVHKQKAMKRLLFLMICVLCVFVEGHAQLKYNIYVRNSEGLPLEQVKLYTFNNKSRAQAAYKVGVKNEYGRLYGVDMSPYREYDEGTTNIDGFCSIKCWPQGSIIVDADDVQDEDYEYEFQLIQVEDYLEENHNYNIVIQLKGKQKDKNVRRAGDIVHITDKSQYKEGEANQGKETELATQVVKATPPMAEAGGGVERYGRNKIVITKELDIDGEYARDDARFVAFPFIIFEEEKDSVVYMPPAVIDGENYNKSMERRMGFLSSHDKLDEYRYDHAMHLQDHNGERFLYSEVANITKGTKYHVPGLLWFEDYNTVYYRDSMLFSDGREREPMRFLDWSEARNLVDVNRQYFEKKATLESVPEDANYGIKFEQGSERLNLSDSMTVAERDNMLSWLSAHSGGEGGIEKITIRGYSSPEGSMRRNRELSRARAATIVSLLKSKFPDVAMSPEFDSIDNIVPWQIVADTLIVSIGDSVARMHAAKIMDIVAGEPDMDKQYRAIRADKELYDYVDKHALDRVRLVNIQARIIVQKILSMEEIVERYDTDPAFRDRLLPYQYYQLMCYFADKERWDDLYYVSEKAYNSRTLSVTVNNKAKWVPKDKSAPELGDTIAYVTERIPYQLAGYYYAVSTLQKGMTNVNILKPYLDEGVVGRREQNGLNSLPFIVAQVLMYCQREDFDEANKLIMKYNLMSYTELEGLIMFVRCLAGYYREKEVGEYIMATSPMNKAVILTALGRYEEALQVLYGKDIPSEDAKAEYLKAICHFRNQNSQITSLSYEAYSSRIVYNEDVDSTQNKNNAETWAAPMLEAIRLDKSNADYLERDGYFNNAYRQLILYFWKRMQAGVPANKAALEYDALVARMRKNKKENMN